MLRFIVKPAMVFGLAFCAFASALASVARTGDGIAATPPPSANSNQPSPVQPSPAAPASVKTSGFLAHYVVFEILRDAEMRAVSHRYVRLARPRLSRPEEDLTAALAGAAVQADREVEKIVVRLVGFHGETVFRDVVEVPRWIRGEFAGLDGNIEGFRVEPDHRAFVVRVPYGEASKLFLQTQGSNAERAFDLNVVAAESESVIPPIDAQAAETDQVLAPAPTTGNRVDILVMGDGYTTTQQTAFTNAATNLANNMFGISPYAEYRSFLLITNLFTASAESGADHPPYQAGCPANSTTCCGDVDAQGDPLAGQFRNTACDARYCTNNIQRLLTVNSTKVFQAAAAVPDWDEIIVIVNDTTYGGAGGAFAVLSAHSSAVAIGQHEYGHSFSRLADEYSDPYPGFPPCSDVSPPPLCEPNVTDETNRADIKWSPWILETTPIPTPDNSTYSSVVGLFQGARYLTTGMFRPRRACTMRYLGADFCEICKQTYILRLYNGWGGDPASGIDNIEPGSESPAPGPIAASYPGSVNFSVSLLPPSSGPGLDVSWWVNGAQVAGASGSSFTYDTTGVGTFDVEIRTHDNTPLVHSDLAGTSLSHHRSWSVEVTAAGHMLTVSRTGNGASYGTVTSSPGGINCGSTCSTSFADSTVVTLSASVASNVTFTGWSGEGCSGTGTCQVTMTQARSVTATFTAPCSVSLSSQTVTTTEMYASCDTLTAGPAFRVASPGDVTFRAAMRVTLTNGFSVGPGATFTAGLDPSLAP